jgi:hypothetical protein
MVASTSVRRVPDMSSLVLLWLTIDNGSSSILESDPGFNSWIRFLDSI